jgi:Na+/H+ antiporter NhaD/arsenite permease-like protein
MFSLMPFIFAVGIIAIAFEEKLKINKAAIALLMAVSLWLIMIFDAYDIFVGRSNPLFNTFLSYHPEMASLPVREQFIRFISDTNMVFHLGAASETLFFVVSALLIVDIVDKHGGFRAMTGSLATINKRKLLWRICFSTFFFAALLDNLAAAVVVLTVLRKLAPHQIDRMKYACMVIISANAGSCWSPIGDVTTILLWVGKNITAWHQISHLFIPGLLNMLVPLVIAHFWLFEKGAVLRLPGEPDPDDGFIPDIPRLARQTIFVVGIFSLALVPVFQIITGLPPFFGVLAGLTLLWIYTDIMYSRVRIREAEKLRIVRLLPNVDLATVFFFLGILMSVSALDMAGHLSIASGLLDNTFSQPHLISFLIGVVSAAVDNVALVAATIGMYPIADAAGGLTDYTRYFVTDGGFWTFLAYCGVTGGSILIIGSATGVTVMGMEKVSFMYYFKRFTPLALAGYLCGAAAYMLLSA